jgi:hypothetical protein
VAQHGRVDDGFSGALRRWRDANPTLAPELRERLSAAAGTVPQGGGGGNDPLGIRR